MRYQTSREGHEARAQSVERQEKADNTEGTENPRSRGSDTKDDGDQEGRDYIFKCVFVRVAADDCG